MSTLQITINAKLTNDKLDVSALSVVTTGIDVNLREHQAIHVGRQGHAMEISLPEDDDLEITILGFTTSGSVTYAMTAESTYEDQAAVSWSTSGNNVESPTLDEEGDYVLNVVATPTSSGLSKPTALSIKVRKPGKDDELPV